MIIGSEFRGTHDNILLSEGSGTLQELHDPTLQSELYYDRRSVSQSVLVSSPHLESETGFLLPSESCGFVDVGRPL
jgi:hypothetical protein